MTTSANAAVEPRKVDAGRGWDWLAEAFAMFRETPGIWIGIAVIYLIIILAASAVHGGSLLSTLFGPVFSGGLILACASQDAGKGVRIEHLFAGFSGGQFGQLVLLAVLYLAAILVVILIGAVLAFAIFGLSPGHLESMRDDPFQYLLPIMLLVAIMLGLFIPVMMGMWLAPALIVLRKLSPVEAFKLSFKACMVNWLPLLVYGLLGLLIAILATIPLALGWLVAAPVFFISIYTAYRDMFPMPPPPPDFSATQPLPVPPPL